MQNLTTRQREALTAAAARWDSSLTVGDWRTWNGLVRRGLAEVRRGRGTGRRGETTYNVIVDVKISAAGREAIA